MRCCWRWLRTPASVCRSKSWRSAWSRGALRQISVRLPAALPEAVVSGPLLRETRSRIEGDERVYECSFQTEVLDRAALTFDLDLPLTAELEVPFVKVADASRLTRWFVLDNASAREAKIATQTALETVAREAVPYLPAGLARPQFFRATGDGDAEAGVSAAHQHGRQRGAGDTGGPDHGVAGGWRALGHRAVLADQPLAAVPAG
jgi:hypothetical protein